MSAPTFFRPGLFSPAGMMRAWHGTNARLFRGVIATQADALLESAQLVHQARSPLTCDATVLPHIGKDRGIRRYTTESELSYRLRLSKWNQIKQSAGRAWGILRQLRILLLPYGRPLLRHVVSAGDGSVAQWCTLESGDGTNDYFDITGLDPEFSSVLATPSNWLWDPGASSGEWSRFFIIIAMDGITNPDVSAGEWDGASLWNGTNVWNGGLSNPVVSDIVALCNDGKAAHSALHAVLFVPNPLTLQPSGMSATVPPWYYTTYPNGAWNDLAKRNPSVIVAYERVP